MLVKHFKIEMEPQVIKRYLGIRKSHTLEPGAEKIIEHMIELGYSLIEPAGYYRIDDLVEVSFDRVEFTSGLKIKSRSVAKLLNNCTMAATMLVTIGEALEKEGARMMKTDDMAEGVILDAVGSDAVEKVADHVNLLVQHEAHSKGLHLTTRYSPGYNDWDITGQGELFPTVDFKELGVKLHKSFFMEPRKSVSAIIGMGGHDKIRRKGSPCKNCQSA